MKANDLLVAASMFAAIEDARVKLTPRNSDERVIAEVRRWLRRRDWMRQIAFWQRARQ